MLSERIDRLVFAGQRVLLQNDRFDGGSVNETNFVLSSVAIARWKKWTERNTVWESGIFGEGNRVLYVVTSDHLLAGIELVSPTHQLCRSQLQSGRPGDQNETVLRMKSQLSKPLWGCRSAREPRLRAN